MTDLDEENQTTKTSDAANNSRKSTVTQDGAFVDPQGFGSASELRMFKSHPSTEYAPDVDADYHDVSEVNRSINAARRALFEATRTLSAAEKYAAQKKHVWRAAHNRTLVTLTGGSERQRTAIADLATEELWGEYQVAEAMVSEQVNHLRAVRAELDALTTLSHNLRAQMQVQ